MASDATADGTRSGTKVTKPAKLARLYSFLGIFVVFVILVSAREPSAVAPQDVEWKVNGGDSNIRYSPLTQIDKSNLTRLQIAWSYDARDEFPGSEMQSNPIVVGGRLYVTTPTLKVVALDAATGREIWKFDPSNGAPPGARFRHRGVTVHDGRVFVTYRNWLYCLDAKNGLPLASFGSGGRVDLREGLGRPAESLSVSASTPGVVFEDLFIIGSTVPETLPSAPGDIRAFDVNTGKLRWSFHTIPHPGEPGSETWPTDAWKIAGGANAWAGVVVDPALAMVFAATGSTSFDFYGANRKGDNLFADCVLALDARTGRRIWHFQGLHHDLWDLDFPAAPNLVTVTRDGKTIDAVAQVTKTGYVFVLDRRTGQPLFPVEERPVPGGAIEGEFPSPTEPVPLAPPPFTRSGPTESMLTTRTPEAHAAVLEQFRGLKSGRFAPPSREGTIIFPGVDGGAEWGGAAFDPASALLYVNANEMPWIVRLIPNDDTSLYNAKCAACHKTDRTGTTVAPSLVDVGRRRSREQIADVIRHGTGRMPAFPDFGTKNVNDMVDFLLTGVDKGRDPDLLNAPTYVKYRSDGETLWRDPDGYPPLTPPWGTLTAIDLNAGTIRWQIPFGEYPELAAKGLRNTGSDNYGGPVVTASGLLFIGATNFDRKFHVFDAATSALLWETTLPAAGNATPAVYAIDGREYVAIVCGGGKNGAPSGASVVAFALPK
jgi:quinoprotein glucose dehydrogenase